MIITKTLDNNPHKENCCSLKPLCRIILLCLLLVGQAVFIGCSGNPDYNSPTFINAAREQRRQQPTQQQWSSRDNTDQQQQHNPTRPQYSVYDPTGQRADKNGYATQYSHQNQALNNAPAQHQGNVGSFTSYGATPTYQSNNSFTNRNKRPSAHTNVGESTKRQQYYSVYDPTNPQADKNGFVAYYDSPTEHPSASRQPQTNYNTHAKTTTTIATTKTTPQYIYYIHDPTNPRADKNGFVAYQGPPVQNAQAPNSEQYGSTQSYVNQQTFTNPQQSPVATNNTICPFPAVSQVSVTGVGVKPSAGSDRSEFPNTPRQNPYLPPSSVNAVPSSNQPAYTTVPATSNNYSPTNITESRSVGQVFVGDTQAPQNIIASNTNITQPAVAQQRVVPDEQYNIEKALSAIKQLVKENPRDTKAQLALRSLYMALGRDTRALELLTEVPIDEQTDSRAIANAMFLAAKINETTQYENPGQADLALSALNALRSKIADKANLVISNLKICQENSVDGFGRYKVIPQEELLSGIKRRISIYCELENFKSEVSADGKYISKLAVQFSLFDAATHTPIVPGEKKDVTDRPSYNQRRDFYLRGSFDIPALKPGKYEIVVQIEDRVAGKLARPARQAFEVK